VIGSKLFCTVREDRLQSLPVSVLQLVESRVLTGCLNVMLQLRKYFSCYYIELLVLSIISEWYFRVILPVSSFGINI
jgi:hypothetical protein